MIQGPWICWDAETKAKEREGHAKVYTYGVAVASPRCACLQHSQILYPVGPNDGHLVVICPVDSVQNVVPEKYDCPFVCVAQLDLDDSAISNWLLNE